METIPMNKKIRVSVEEKITYVETFVMEIPEDYTENDINNLLDEAQTKSETSGDVTYMLEKRGFKISEASNQFPDSPNDQELEINDYSFVKEISQ